MARLSSVVVLIGSLTLSPHPAAAQLPYGSLGGNIPDESHGGVPAATIAITHNGTGASRETTSDDQGAYRFASLQPGTYTVTVKVDGFRTLSRQDVVITLN